jgi:predicted ATPase
MIAQLCRLSERHPLEVRAKKLCQVLAALGLDSDIDAQYLLQLLSTPPGMAPMVGCNAEAVSTQIFALLHQICLKGSQKQPLVIALENLHWIDAASQKLCDMLLNLLVGAPILVLATYRFDYQPQWLAKSYVTQIVLPPLTPEQSLMLVNAVCGDTSLPPQKTHKIVSMANGNPFFLEELTRTARLSEADPCAPVRVPDTVQNVLMTRLGRLPEIARRLLQMAAVLGPSWPLHRLETIWDGVEPLVPLLWKLQEGEFLYEQTATSEPSYAFRDPLMQEVAYNSLTLARRQALHAAAEEALEHAL